MPFQVFDDSGQGIFLVLLIVGTLVSIVAIALRFFATYLSRRKPGLEDWLALAALAVFLARVGVASNGPSAEFARVLARPHQAPAI